MEWRIQNDLEGSGCGLIKILSGNLPRGAEEIHENLIRITDVLPEIQSKHL
jgi:hypothetical protein